MDYLERLRYLMKQRDLTEYKLSHISDVPQSTINSLFKKNYLPTIPTLEALCNGMGITLSEFFYRPDQKKTTDEEEQELLQKWNLLTTKEHLVLLQFIDLLLD